MEQATRNPALERLDAFVGAWSIEASIPSFGPTGTAGRSVFEWALGGQFLVQRSEVDHPQAPNALMVHAVDPETGAYTQHYFDSRGVVRVYDMSFEDGVWKLVRDKPDFTPLKFAQRFVGRFSGDGSTIAGAWEASHDGGSTWELDFELTYKRTEAR